MHHPAPYRCTLSGRLAVLFTGAALALAGCGGGGGGGGDAPPPADPFFTTATPYGGSALPQGAELLNNADFKTWAGSDRLVYVSSADQTAAEADLRTRRAQNKALVDAAALQNPAIARLLRMPGTSNADVTVHADGTRSTLLPGDTTPVRLQGPSQAYADIAASLRSTNARSNVEAVYRVLYDMLPLDQRGGLPTLAALSGTDDTTLQTARSELARRLQHLLPGEDTPALPPSLVATGTAIATAQAQALPQTTRPHALAARRLDLSGYELVTHCPSPVGTTMIKQYSWALKGHVTPTRWQGHRGTCVAHGILAGIETFVSRHSGRLLDLSEQELYAVAKYDWDRESNDYGDGLSVADTLDRMKSTAYRTDNESAWAYNYSEKRVEHDSSSTYTQSCMDYSGPCSDTNHQRPIKCTQINGLTACAFKLPPSVTNPGSDNQRLTGYVSLWDHFAPEDSLAAIRAMLNAGRPVVASIDVDKAMKSAGAADHYPKPGVVNYAASSEIVGGHGIAIVGYLSNGWLDSNDRDPSGGYLVLKNSWGCKGDQGYYFVPYSWAVDNVQGAWAITGVSSTVAAPQFALAVSKAIAKSAGELSFTVNGNVAMGSIELFSPGATTPFMSWAPPQGSSVATGPVTLQISAFDFAGLAEGKNWVIASVRDEGGTVVATNWVTFFRDTLPPAVTLQATPSTLAVPGTLALSATASDSSGIAKVEFFRGFTKLATVATAPYQFNLGYAAGDLGTSPFVALATDNAGRVHLSNVENVTSVGLVKPIIGSFSATPNLLGAGGGTATLSWNVLGASSVSIDNGVGTQPASGSFTVNVTSTTLFTLTATNAKGTTTQTATVAVQVVLPPQISSFTAAPATLPAGGGTATLAWSIANTADTVSIAPGVGNVTGQTSKVVSVPATTTFTLSASNAGGTRTQQVTVTVAPDTSAPTVSLAAAPAALSVAGNVTLSATASDNVGVTRVEFWRGSTLLGQATAAPFTQLVGLTAADNGSVAFTAKAFDAAGNSSTSAAATVGVAIPLPDTTSPTVSLTASAQNVTAPGSTTLTANAADNVGVSRVDFYEGSTLLGSSTAAPYTQAISFTTAQTGSHSYTARAFDAAGNNTLSAALAVVVSLPVTADRYVNPMAGSDASDGLSAATAYKTLTKAFSTVGASGTVWLANGTYTAANEGVNTGVATLLTVPAGRTVRALTDGQAVLNFGLAYTASGSAIGLAFDGLAASAGMTGIDASAGTVSLSKLSFINLGNVNSGGGGFNARAALRVYGTAVVTLDAGAGNPLVMGQGVQVGALVFDSAKLTLNGGTLQPTGACGGGCVAQMKLGGTAQLTLDGAVIALTPSGDTAPQPMGLLVGSASMTIRNASISQTGSGTARDLVIVNEAATFTLANSTVGSTFHNIVGFQNGTPTANLQNVTVSGTVGTVAGATFFQAGPSPTINVTGGNFSNITGVNGFNATLLEGSTGASSTINITGATFANNPNVVNLGGTGTRNLRVRGSTFTGNSSCGSACYTFLLAGDAASVFDLGTAADPGANTIQATTTGRGVVVNASAAVTVNAVGNTWKAGVQGANGSGQYALGTAPCTANSCSVSTGSGANYSVSGGALRLAGN